EGGEAPRGASEVQLENGDVEGEIAGAGEGERGGDDAEDEGIFVAAVLDEEAFFEVDAPDGDDHRGEDGGGGEGGQQAEGEREAAEELAGAGEESERLAGAEADGVEEGTRGADAVAAEDAEEFLGAVGGEGEAEGETNEEKADFHECAPFAGAPKGFGDNLGPGPWWSNERTSVRICSKMIQIQEPVETAELLAFARVVDAKSLSRAAAELGVPGTTLGRR